MTSIIPFIAALSPTAFIMFCLAMISFDNEAKTIIRQQKGLDSFQVREQAGGTDTYTVADALGLLQQRKIPVPEIQIGIPQIKQKMLVRHNVLFANNRIVQEVSFKDRNPDLYNFYTASPQIHDKLLFTLSYSEKDALYRLKRKA